MDKPVGGLRRLTGAQIALLQACLTHAIDTNELARIQYLSPHTVATYFKDINKRIGSADRFAAVLHALQTGVA